MPNAFAETPNAFVAKGLSMALAAIVRDGFCEHLCRDLLGNDGSNSSRDTGGTSGGSEQPVRSRYEFLMHWRVEDVFERSFPRDVDLRVLQAF